MGTREMVLIDGLPHWRRYGVFGFATSEPVKSVLFEVMQSLDDGHYYDAICRCIKVPEACAEFARQRKLDCHNASLWIANNLVSDVVLTADDCLILDCAKSIEGNLGLEKESGSVFVRLKCSDGYNLHEIRSDTVPDQAEVDKINSFCFSIVYKAASWCDRAMFDNNRIRNLKEFYSNQLREKYSRK